MKNANAVEVARGEGWSFWQIGDQVYRSANNPGFDTDGLPLGRRWESSIDHWNRYRVVFAWAVDVAVAAA
jgi:hypothetical protein